MTIEHKVFQSEPLIEQAFSQFFPKPATEDKAPQKKTAGMKFEDPTRCQYCGKEMVRSSVKGEAVLVCWEDRNVTPIFTGEL